MLLYYYILIIIYIMISILIILPLLIGYGSFVYKVLGIGLCLALCTTLSIFSIYHGIYDLYILYMITVLLWIYTIIINNKIKIKVPNISNNYNIDDLIDHSTVELPY
jgi:hypothetical protein